MENTRLATDQEKEALEYLNEMRMKGDINMFGASPFLEAEFEVTREEALRLLVLWMENFNEEGNYETLKN
jgi:hypothetical protein